MWTFLIYWTIALSAIHSMTKSAKNQTQKILCLRHLLQDTDPKKTQTHSTKQCLGYTVEIREKDNAAYFRLKKIE